MRSITKRNILVIAFAVISLSSDMTAAESIQSSNKAIMKIKGFYIGMPVADCLNLINGKYRDIFLKQPIFFLFDRSKLDSLIRQTCLRKPDSTNIQDSTEAYVRSYYTNAFLANCNVEDMSLSFTMYYVLQKGHIKLHGDSDFEFDDRGNLLSFRICSEDADQLFNAADMDAQEFAQAIVDNYHIPELSVITDENYQSYWVYKTTDGQMIIVTSHKELMIKSIPKSSERGFD